MPNPYQTMADGEEIIVIFIPIWVDDVSGNKSKQYNKHLNIYIANSNVPGRLLQQEYFIHFVSTSPHASSPEQIAAVLDAMRYVVSFPRIAATH